jgi:hypothetical protein
MSVFKNNAKHWKLPETLEILKWAFTRKLPQIPNTDILPILQPNLDLIHTPKHKVQVSQIIIEISQLGLVIPPFLFNYQIKTSSLILFSAVMPLHFNLQDQRE